MRSLNLFVVAAILAALFAGIFTPAAPAQAQGPVLIENDMTPIFENGVQIYPIFPKELGSGGSSSMSFSAASAGECGMPTPAIDSSTYGDIRRGDNYARTSASFCNGHLVAQAWSIWAGRPPIDTGHNRQNLSGSWKVVDVTAGEIVEEHSFEVSNDPAEGVLVYDDMEFDVPAGRTYRIEISVELRQNRCRNGSGSSSSSAEGSMPPPQQPVCLSASAEPAEGEIPYDFTLTSVNVDDPDDQVAAYRVVGPDGKVQDVTDPIGLNWTITSTGTHTVDVDLLTDGQVLSYETCQAKTVATDNPTENNPTDIVVNATCPDAGQDSNRLEISGRVIDGIGPFDVLVSLPGTETTVRTDRHGRFELTLEDGRAFIGQSIKFSVVSYENIATSLEVTSKMFALCHETPTNTTTGGQDYLPPWEITRAATEYESTWGFDYFPFYGERFSPAAGKVLGSGKDNLPSYDNRGDGKDPSVPNSSGGPFLSASVVYTEPTEAFTHSAYVNIPEARNTDVAITIQRDIRPISKDGKVVGVVLVSDPYVIGVGSIDGGGPYQWYQQNNVGANSLVAVTVPGRWNNPARDLGIGWHSVKGLGNYAQHARASWFTDPCANGNCKLEDFDKATKDANLMAQVAFDQFLGRAGGNSADGQIYWWDGVKAVKSGEAWMASQGLANWVYDPDNGNRVPSWIRDLPTGTILPFVPGRGGSFPIALQAETDGTVSMSCKWDDLHEYARNWQDQIVNLNPDDYRGPWTVPSPCTEGKVAFYGVSGEYARLIQDDPAKLNELATLLPEGKLHVVDIPAEYDIPEMRSEQPVQATEIQNYTVQPGDTLSGIAKQFGTTVDEIASANQIENVDLIIVGQVLTIP